MKKILVVAECINKNKTSEGIGTTSFLNALAQGPFEVDCVYFQHVQHELSDTSHIDKRINLIKIENGIIDQIVQKVRPVRRWTQKNLGVNILRARRAAKFQKALKRLIKKGNYNLLFVRTIAGSIASHTAVFNLSKQLDFKWVVNFNDPAPASLMPYPYFDGKTDYPKQMANDEAVVKEIVRSCDGITSPSVLLTQRFLDFTGVRAEDKKVYKFPHIFVAPQHIKTPSFLDKGKFNVVHPGSLLGPRNPEFLLKAFKTFIEQNPEKAAATKLTFFGTIHAKHKPLFDAFPHPEFLDVRDKRIPHEEALGVLQESSVLIILEAIADESPFMPGKLAEFIGLIKTVWALSPKKSETRRILGLEYPYQCEANNEDEIYKQLNALFDAWKENKQLPLSNEKLLAYVSPKHVVEEMEKILSEIV
jgi:hypothetical protein